MSTDDRPYFEAHTEALAARITTGLHKLGLAMKQQSWQQAHHDGLSATQGQLLAALLAHGPLTGSELSERLGVTLPTVSDSARVLEEKALIAKVPDPRHPRARLLTLTESGQALGSRARAWPEFLAHAVDALSPDEARVFFAGIVKMIRMLQEQGLVPTSGMCVHCTHFRPNVRAGPSPHHCALVDAPLADHQLRLDCPDHTLAPPAQRSAAWAQFNRAG